MSPELGIDEFESLGSTNPVLKSAEKNIIQIKIKDIKDPFPYSSLLKLSRVTAIWY